MADQEGGGIFISPLNRGDIGQFQRSAPAIIGVSRICCKRSNAPSRRIKICHAPVSMSPAAVSTFTKAFSAAKIASGERPRWRDGHETEINALRLFAEDIHFHPRYMQQLLAQGFGVTHQLPRRLSRLQGKKRKGDVSGIHGIHHQTETPADVFASSPSFLRA